MADQVRLTADEDARVPRLTRADLMKQVDAEIQYLAANMAKGIEDYRHRTGRIAGLQVAIQICENVEKLVGG